MSDTRPMPEWPEPDTERFWAGCREYRLTYGRCGACGAAVFYPRPHCPVCWSRDVSEATSAGVGTVHAHTVMRRGQGFFRERAPYVVAWIDLDEGFRMLSEVVGAAPDEIGVGSKVTVDWEVTLNGGDPVTVVPVFRLQTPS